MRGPDGRGARGETGAAALMGTGGRWLAFTGEHDGVDARSTVVFTNDQWDDGALHPSSHWFVRAEPTPTVAVSWAFYQEFTLPPGDSFSWHYRVVVADGEPDRDRIESCLSRSRELTEFQADRS